MGESEVAMCVPWFSFVTCEPCQIEIEYTIKTMLLQDWHDFIHGKHYYLKKTLQNQVFIQNQLQF